MLINLRLIIALFMLALVVAPAKAENTTFLVGTAMADVTGPAAEIGMMGFARMDQKTSGLHTRLWARAFVIEDQQKNRVVYVNCDLWAITQAVKVEVVKRLQQKYGQNYTVNNVMLCGTHTHAGPGGYSHYTLYNLTILGFCEQNFEVIVDGIVSAIEQAHNRLAPAKIFLAQGELTGAAKNRSLEAYQANVDAHLYPNVDPTFTVLRFERLNGQAIGMISWFGVHTTSIFYGHDQSFDHPNTLISSDNKGWAELAFEKTKNTQYRSDKETFVAAFANTTLGDTSPNIYGGQEGGGINDYASNHISGEKQLAKAQELYDNARQALSAQVASRHIYRDFSKITVEAQYTDGQPRKTTYAAIGLAFIAGAEDGPSKIPFVEEGQYKGKYHESHGTKPIFLETGKMQPPWTPEVLPVQMFRIGELALLAVPGEFTTHSGRRILQTVKQDLERIGVHTSLITGPANAYAGYVATREEYNEQHYEGASTHFGQWTLGAFRQQFKKLSASLVTGEIPPSGPTPRDLTGKQISLQPKVVFDAPPLGKEFGDLLSPIPEKVEKLSLLQVQFWGAHLNNAVGSNQSFFQIERKTDQGWQTVRWDHDADTALLWERHGIAASKISIMWDIPADAPTGWFRVGHQGKYKEAWSDTLYPYQGYSNEFQLVAATRLKIISCQVAGKQVSFELAYPPATTQDLYHKTPEVKDGEIRFVVNNTQELVALPSKAKVGEFVAQIPVKAGDIHTITVRQGDAQDQYGNGNLFFEKKISK